MTKSILIGCLVVVAISTAGVAMAASTEKVKQKAAETADATGEWAKETKEDFQKEMEKELADMKVQIDALKTRISETSGTVSDKAKVQMNDKLAKLEKQRDDLDQRVNKASSTSGRAWNKMKLGMKRAVGELKVAYREARKEIQGDETQKENEKNAELTDGSKDHKVETPATEKPATEKSH